jgi:hypothetical protein
MQVENSDSTELKAIREEIQQLKNRINLMEAILDIRKWKKLESIATIEEQPDEDFELSFPFKSDDSIEFRVGEYGMAWFGNIVLLFGIAFLIQYLQHSQYQLLAAFTGLISITGIYTVCYFTRNSYSYLSKLFAYNGHILLFYWTLRLHFFQTEPLIKSEFLGLFIMLGALSGLFYLSFRRKSQLMAGMVLLMFLISGVISNSTNFAATMILAVALLSMALYYHFGWLRLVFIYILLTYFSFLNLLLNNPLVGNSPEFISSSGILNLFFIGSGFIFSLLALIPKKEEISNDFVIATGVWNGLGFSSVLAIIAITYLSKSYVPYFASISVFCLIFSVILQSRSNLKIMASIYALYGFLGMSVAFYGILLFPRAYMLFSIQSLLVVSMALWFRSRFIVVMNTILFVTLLIFYLSNKTSYNSINFSFMLVAFITARVINWKKERLNIKTELIRNTYLVAGFIMTLVAFYHAFPASYITVSWIAGAMLFFILSRLLRNIKYRWLAIATLIVSGIKLIFADLSDLDIGYRVLIFLLLAVISITVSVLYTKFLIKKKE